MIFGFNTDIKYEGTVYHVQSEARQHDLLLQTQVFVRGRCIGKHANSYADKVSQPGFSDEHMHDLLKSQHKSVIEAIRRGKLEEVIGLAAHPGESTSRIAAADSAPAPAALVLDWLNRDAVYHDDSVVMKFIVRYGSAQVAGAQLTSKLILPSDAPSYAQATTDGDGTAEIRVAVREDELTQASMLVQAVHNGHHATRKFRLRRTR